MSGTLKIGTRGSQLALAQARRVQSAFSQPSQIEIIRTSGDRFRDQPLGKDNPVGFFTKEIEQVLSSQQIDMAVHSLKDLPIETPAGLVLAALLARDDPGDMLLCAPQALDDTQPDPTQGDQTLPLRAGATIGASSLRRGALLTHYRSDLHRSPIRGNVPTRVQKVIDGDYDAIILSRAGLVRLQFDVAPLVAFDLNPRCWPPAPGQAVIAVEIRDENQVLHKNLDDLDHKQTRRAVECERGLLKAIGGGCHAPFGAFADQEANDSWRVVVAAPNAQGTTTIAHFCATDLDQAAQQAQRWIQTGCQAKHEIEEKTWLCRKARPWC